MGFMDQFNQSYGQQQIPLLQRPQQPIQAPQITASPFGPQQPDEEVTVGAGPEPGEELFNAFKQNVLNPPQRTQMTYPPNILAGLTKALDVARTPTDYEKNRVYVDGNAYQKAKVFDDKTTGKRHFIEPYKQPSFMQNVMQAMPEAVSVAPAIENQRRADEMGDWDLKNKGYAAAINANSQMELAKQRGAQADWYSQRPDIERDKLELSRLTADERVRVSRLKTMTDRQLELERQSGRMSLAEYNAVQALKRVEAQQAGATQRVGMQQAGATERTDKVIAGNQALEKIRQTGRIDLEDLRSLNDQELEELKQDNRIDLDSRRHINREIEIRSRGREARETKTTPGAINPQSSAGNYPTQQKQAAINKANEVLNTNPQWKDLITFDPQSGMPRLAEPSDPWFGEPDYTEYDKAYEALYGRKRGAGVTAPTAPAAPTNKTPTSTTTTPPKQSTNTTTTPGATPKVNPPNTVDQQTKDNARRQQAATDILRQNKKPVTPANIEWVIKQGMVK